MMTLQDDVVSYYLSIERNLTQTAKHYEISRCKCRKMLIDAGVFESPLSRQIAGLSADGLTVEQIGEKLGISPKVASSYLPYSKGMYNAEEPSENALSIRRHRQKARQQ